MGNKVDSVNSTTSWLNNKTLRSALSSFTLLLVLLVACFLSLSLAPSRHRAAAPWDTDGRAAHDGVPRTARPARVVVGLARTRVARRGCSRPLPPAAWCCLPSLLHTSPLTLPSRTLSPAGTAHSAPLSHPPRCWGALSRPPLLHRTSPSLPFLSLGFLSSHRVLCSSLATRGHRCIHRRAQGTTWCTSESPQTREDHHQHSSTLSKQQFFHRQGSVHCRCHMKDTTSCWRRRGKNVLTEMATTQQDQISGELRNIYF